MAMTLDEIRLAELKEKIAKAKSEMEAKRSKGECGERSGTSKSGSSKVELKPRTDAREERASGLSGDKDVAAMSSQDVKGSRATRRLVVGKPWDNLIDPKLDVLCNENQKDLDEQQTKSRVSFYGIDCKSFSRARDRPVRGAKSYPRRLRSNQ